MNFSASLPKFNFNQMRSLKCALTIIFLILSIVHAGESVDFNKLAEEKARIKAENNDEASTVHSGNIKPTPGQLIFENTLRVTPTSETEVKSVINPTPTAQSGNSPKSGDQKKQKKKEKKQSEVDNNNDDDDNDINDEEEDKPSNSSSSDKKNNKGRKKKSSDPDSSSSDTKDSEELPKRLFRPRFRAESSAESLKISILITISLSSIGLLFI